MQKIMLHLHTKYKIHNYSLSLTCNKLITIVLTSEIVTKIYLYLTFIIKFERNQTYLLCTHKTNQQYLMKLDYLT